MFPGVGSGSFPVKTGAHRTVGSGLLFVLIILTDEDCMGHTLTHTHTQTHTQRQTDRETVRQRQREREAEKVKLTGIAIVLQ